VRVDQRQSLDHSSHRISQTGKADVTFATPAPDFLASSLAD